MKTITASLFLLLIFSITQSSFPFGVANAANVSVVDINGDEVLSGVPYYVLSRIGGLDGGGLDIGRDSYRQCPEIVVQRFHEFDFGRPVIFTNANSSDDVVRLSSDERVKYAGHRDRLCLTSTVWKVQDEDKTTGKRWVELGGSEGDPSCDNVDSWFKIELVSPHVYMFTYCPSVCNSTLTSCYQVARFPDIDGQLRFALAETTGYSWIFIKANEANSRIRQVVPA